MIFIKPKLVKEGMKLNREGRKLQRKRQKLYFTGKTSRFQSTYQMEIRLPFGISYSAALIILTQGGYPLQAYKTQVDFEPSSRKYSQVKDSISKFAMPFDNFSDWCMAQAAFSKTLVSMNKFEEKGLTEYARIAMDKFTEISTTHQSLMNGRAIAFQKFLIFESEVRKRIEDNDQYEWGDEEVWIDIAKKFPNAREIATNAPFRPTEAWILEDGTQVSIETSKGKVIGTPQQFSFQQRRDTDSQSSNFPRAGPAIKRGTSSRGSMRGGGRGLSFGGVTHSHESNTGAISEKMPCERFNRGNCSINAADCRFAHYCAQWRNEVGKGCGPKAHHGFHTHEIVPPAVDSTHPSKEKS